MTTQLAPPVLKRQLSRAFRLLLHVAAAIISHSSAAVRLVTYRALATLDIWAEMIEAYAVAAERDGEDEVRTQSVVSRSGIIVHRRPPFVFPISLDETDIPQRIFDYLDEIGEDDAIAFKLKENRGDDRKGFRAFIPQDPPEYVADNGKRDWDLPLIRFGLVCRRWAAIHHRHKWSFDKGYLGLCSYDLDGGLRQDAQVRSIMTTLRMFAGFGFGNLTTHLRVNVTLFPPRGAQPGRRRRTSREARAVRVGFPQLDLAPLLPNLERLGLEVLGGGGPHAQARLLRVLVTLGDGSSIKRLGISRIDSRRPFDVTTCAAFLAGLTTSRWSSLEALELAHFTVVSNSQHTSLPVPLHSFPTFRLRTLCLSKMTLSVIDLWWIGMASVETLRSINIWRCSVLAADEFALFLATGAPHLTDLQVGLLESQKNDCGDLLAALPLIKVLSLGSEQWSSAPMDVLSRLHPSAYNSISHLTLSKSLAASNLLDFVMRCSALEHVKVGQIDNSGLDNARAYKELVGYCRDARIVVQAGYVPIWWDEREREDERDKEILGTELLWRDS